MTSIRQITPSLAAPWAHGAGGWVFFGCVALSFLALFVYIKRQPRGRRAARIALGVARALTLSLLLLFLADPVLSVVVGNRPRPLVWVLLDGTDSMNIRDEFPAAEATRLNEATGVDSNIASKDAADIKPAPAAEKVAEQPLKAPATDTPRDAKLDDSKLGHSRADYVRAWLRKRDGNVLAKLEEKFRLKGFVFERPDAVAGLESGDGQTDRIDFGRWSEELTTRGQVTALGAALEDLGSRHAMGSLAGVVVVSDFDQNSGPPPLAKAKSLNVPIYTIGVGPTTALDLAIDLQAPPMMKKAERATVTVVVRQTGLDGQSAPVSVTARRLGAR